MRIGVILRPLLFSLGLICLFQTAFAQVSVGISVSFGPPPIPIYEQPVCPADGYLWVPGYWAYDDEIGYYWVPGTWVEPPEVGFLWTPGYWGWGGSAFIFRQGYWGPHVGFYGGINYGFGYGGVGYNGGRWEGNHFAYNTYVNHVNTTIIHNTYNVHVTNVTETRVSYNGGDGGIQARPTRQEQAYTNERRMGPVAAQTQHVQIARGNPELRAAANRGKPAIAATARPGNFNAGVVAAREAGGEYKSPPPNAAHGPAHGANPPTYTHASQLQPHATKPPNTGDTLDKRYQQQQEKLAAKQNQEHQKLQQQQEKQHQQASQKGYNDAQRQAMEQRHAQQTQQLQQKHATQQQHLEERQGSHPPAPKPEGHSPAEKH